MWVVWLSYNCTIQTGSASVHAASVAAIADEKFSRYRQYFWKPPNKIAIFASSTENTYPKHKELAHMKCMVSWSNEGGNMDQSFMDLSVAN